jgi:hypothetical protein
MSRPLPKKAIFEKFKPAPAARQLFDREIHRLILVGEVSPATVNIAAGEQISAFYVVLVSLKGAECDQKNLALLGKLIPRNMLFVLEHGGQARLAAYRAGRVVQSAWKPLEEWVINLTGLDLDSVWKNIIIQIGGLEVAEGRTLDEQLADDEARAKILRRIDRLEKQARNEKQPRRKWELVEEAQKLKKQLEHAL